jgi:hypothetical protein
VGPTERQSLKHEELIESSCRLEGSFKLRKKEKEPGGQLVSIFDGRER